MFIRLAAIVGFAFILTFSTRCEADFVIDDYSVGDTLTQFSSGTASQTTHDKSILGGARDETLTVPDLGGSEFLGVIGYGPSLQIAQGVNDEINGSFLYNDFGTIDLTDGGRRYAFQLSVITVNSATPITDAFSIRVTSGANSSIVGFDLPGNSSVPANVQVGFDQFSGVDFSALDSIELLFDLSGAPGTDLTIGSFTAIPEPTSSVLLAATLVPVCFRRRRAI